MSSGLTGVWAWALTSCGEGTSWKDVLGRLSIYKDSVYRLTEEGQRWALGPWGLFFKSVLTSEVGPHDSLPTRTDSYPGGLISPVAWHRPVKVRFPAAKEPCPCPGSGFVGDHWAVRSSARDQKFGLVGMAADWATPVSPRALLRLDAH